MTNYEQALGYLKTAASRGSVLGLERISRLAELLGDPQDKVKTIHISGTNGKGSLGAMLCSVLKARTLRPVTAQCADFRGKVCPARA